MVRATKADRRSRKIKSSVKPSTKSSITKTTDDATVVVDAKDSLAVSSTDVGEYHVPHTIHGQVVRLDVQTGGAIGLKVACDFHGSACTKWRSTKLDQHIFGKRAAEFYLATWLSKSKEMSLDDHYAWRPKRSEVQLFVDANPHF